MAAIVVGWLGGHSLQAKLTNLAVGFLILWPLVGLHEMTHAFLAAIVGARVRFRSKIKQRRLQFSVQMSGIEFSWSWFMVVIAAPTVVVNCIGIGICMFNTWKVAPVLVALCLHLCGCIGDWNALMALLKLPSSTKITDVDDGFSYRYEVRGTFESSGP